MLPVQLGTVGYIHRVFFGVITPLPNLGLGDRMNVEQSDHEVVRNQPWRGVNHALCSTFFVRQAVLPS